MCLLYTNQSSLIGQAILSVRVHISCWIQCMLNPSRTYRVLRILSLNARSPLLYNKPSLTMLLALGQIYTENAYVRILFECACNQVPYTISCLWSLSWNEGRIGYLVYTTTVNHFLLLSSLSLLTQANFIIFLICLLILLLSLIFFRYLKK